jgi:hypothetical protein
MPERKQNVLFVLDEKTGPKESNLYPIKLERKLRSKPMTRRQRKQVIRKLNDMASTLGVEPYDQTVLLDVNLDVKLDFGAFGEIFRSILPNLSGLKDTLKSSLESGIKVKGRSEADDPQIKNKPSDSSKAKKKAPTKPCSEKYGVSQSGD